MNNRRHFLKSCTLGGIVLATTNSLGSKPYLRFKGESSGLQLSYRPYDLQLRHIFTVASNSRTTTPVVLTELHFEGYTGFGEASMPPYLGESHATVMDFLSKADLSQFKDPFQREKILDYVDHIAPGNYAAKAAIDIALHDLVGKMIKQPWYRILGLDASKTPFTSFTIGIDTPEMLRKKVEEANPYRILKVKLGKENDAEIIETIRSVSDKPLCVDVNQGWKDRNKALEMIHWLKEKGVVFIEQPMPKNLPDDNAWLTAHSPLPIIGDEAIQTPEDVLPSKGVYSGINIKLMKCGGIRNAWKMFTLAKSLNMKVMIGCMTETSCAVSAAAQLSPLADWADLDGNLLISNDVFQGTTIVEGKITLNDWPGIGIKKLEQ